MAQLRQGWARGRSRLLPAVAEGMKEMLRHAAGQTFGHCERPGLGVLASIARRGALEFAAFLNYVRSQVTSTRFHHRRFFHIFDSRVVACIAAKGRSSSKLLNRLCRRYAALALASDCYVLTLWTISSWNRADLGSRLCSRNGT